MSEESFTIFHISPRGPFSLAEAASFGFGQREGQDTGAGMQLMRLAFCVDGYAVQAGVEVRQDAAGDVRGTGAPAAGHRPGAVRDQVARVLSLDHDATEFVRVGERDPPRRLLPASLGQWAGFSVLASSRSPCRGPARNRTSTCRRSA